MDNPVIEIPVSKRKLILLACLSVLFVVLCVWLWGYSEEQTEYPPLLVKVVSVVGVVFFGAGAVLLPRKAFNRGLSLIVSDEGITDNYRAKGVLIRWEDVTDIRIEKVMMTNMLLIVVHNPEKYLALAPENFRRGMLNDFNMCGTPFVIPSGVFARSLKKMERLMKERRGMSIRFR